MTPKNASKSTASITREQLIDLLNQDLAREFQAIIGYVNYSQVLKGAAYMNIAGELEKHATEELSHPNPVFHGDTLFAETEVLEVRPSASKPDRGIVAVETRGFNQNKERVIVLRRRYLAPKKGTE